MTFDQIRQILTQARETGSIQKIFFEGGEPFLFYSTLINAVQAAVDAGFQTGIVSNAYWATSREDARACLMPFTGLVEGLTLSCDRFHSGAINDLLVRNAAEVAKELGFEVGTISIPQPDAEEDGEGTLKFRGRAARNLTTRARLHPWEQFTACPYEDLRDPGRVHLDPFGLVHLCQGISLGNIYTSPLAEICASYDPGTHPIAGPLCNGGPVALVSEYALPHAVAYADACHLCYEARLALRDRFPEILAPDQMYGIGLE